MIRCRQYTVQTHAISHRIPGADDAALHILRRQQPQRRQHVQLPPADVPLLQRAHKHASELVMRGCALSGAQGAACHMQLLHKCVDDECPLVHPACTVCVPRPDRGMKRTWLRPSTARLSTMHTRCPLNCTATTKVSQLSPWHPCSAKTVQAGTVTAADDPPAARAQGTRPACRRRCTHRSRWRRAPCSAWSPPSGRACPGCASTGAAPGQQACQHGMCS